MTSVMMSHEQFSYIKESLTSAKELADNGNLSKVVDADKFNKERNNVNLNKVNKRIMSYVESVTHD